MLRWIANFIMNDRARRLSRRIEQSVSQAALEQNGGRLAQSEPRIADIGSGTGHNAARLSSTWNCRVDEYDVCDMHWLGDGPILFQDSRLPCRDKTYDMVLLLFVLQYPEQPSYLLQELHRVLKEDGIVVVLQCVHRSPLGRRWLQLRETAYGPFAFHLARAARLIATPTCSVVPRRYYQPSQLEAECRRNGFTPKLSTSYPGWLSVRDELVVLAKTSHGPTDLAAGSR